VECVDILNRALRRIYIDNIYFVESKKSSVKRRREVVVEPRTPLYTFRRRKKKRERERERSQYRILRSSFVSFSRVYAETPLKSCNALRFRIWLESPSFEIQQRASNNTLELLPLNSRTPCYRRCACGQPRSTSRVAAAESEVTLGILIKRSYYVPSELPPGPHNKVNNNNNLASLLNRSITRRNLS